MSEQKVYGRKACLALLEHRPEDVLRLYHAPELRGELAGILPWLAARRLAYRELDSEGLAKVAGGPHHEGLVLSAKPILPQGWPPPEVPPGRSKSIWLALDGVANPHNLGAILRTAAFFGVNGVLLGGFEPGEKINPAVLRVAEGGAEWVPLFAAPNLPVALADLMEAGFGVIGLETDSRATLSDVMGSGMAAGGVVAVLGGEREGLSPEVRRACGTLCALEGRGRMQSLNVSVATAVALALLARGPSSPRTREAGEIPRRAAGDTRNPAEHEVTGASSLARGAPQQPRPPKPNHPAKSKKSAKTPGPKRRSRPKTRGSPKDKGKPKPKKTRP